MIDIDRVRSDPAGVAAALAKRGAQVDFAELLEWDARRRSLIVEGDTLRARRNEVSGQIPRFKRRGRDSVTIPQDVRIRDGKLWFPKIGWLALRRRGGNPHPDAEPVQAVLKRVNGKWMAVVCYAVAATARPDDGTVTGVDMNVRQVAVSDGRRARIVHAPDSRRLEARVRRYQRRLARQRRGSRWRERTRRRLARTQRRIAQRRICIEVAGRRSGSGIVP